MKVFLKEYRGKKTCLLFEMADTSVYSLGTGNYIPKEEKKVPFGTVVPFCCAKMQGTNLAAAIVAYASSSSVSHVRFCKHWEQTSLEKQCPTLSGKYC